MTSEPDPRTDLAGWLGLKPAHVSRCRSEAEDGDGTVAAAVGRRLIAQDQVNTPDPEPDEGPPGTVPVTMWLDAEPNGYGWRRLWTSDEEQLSSHSDGWWRDRGFPLPAPKPPWTSPLPNLPDLTEQQCREAVEYLDEGNGDCVMAQIGRALKAADWTPERGGA